MEKKSKKTGIILLLVVILIQLIYFIVVFATEKTAFYEDEFFSYGLANSYHRPFLNGTAIQQDDNYNSWETGESFKYYLRTTKDTAFNYANVWSNQTADTHPPLFYAVLHTISSFFPEQFSWWWGFSINLAAFAVMQIYLYQWIKSLSGSELATLTACIFWGFSIACLNIIMFIRMYAMLVMFGVMFACYAQRALQRKELTFRHDMLPIMLVTFLGALTQHLFLIYAFFYTLMQCLYFICRKRFHNMFIFGFSALMGVILSIAAFPASVSHVFTDPISWSGELNATQQSYLMERILLAESTGYVLSFFQKGNTVYFAAALIMIFILSVPVLYLFRDKLKLRERLPILLKKISTLNYSGMIAVISSVIYLHFISGRFYYFDIGEYSDRYIFIIMPILIGVVIGLSYKLTALIRPDKLRKIIAGIFTIIFAAVLIYQNTTDLRDMFLLPSKESYLLKADPDNGSVNSYIQGQDCILVMKTPIYMPCYSLMLQDAGNIYITLSGDNMYQTQEESYKEIFEKQDEFYLLLDNSLSVADEIEIAEENLSPVKSIEVSNDNAEFQEKQPVHTIEEAVAYYEEVSGFTSEYCTSEQTHYCITIRLYKFTRKT